MDRFSPVPKVRRIRANAAVTNAPAITEAHDTPEAYASFVTPSSGNCD